MSQIWMISFPYSRKKDEDFIEPLPFGQGGLSPFVSPFDKDQWG